VAKQLEERDVGHLAKISKLRGRVAELLDEKEQSESQLKKTQDTLVISKAAVSSFKKELQALKEQATSWEVDIS
jgi:chromosome segregation ATPase